MNPLSKHKSLERLLEDLKTIKFSFEKIVEMLFIYNFEDFDYLFHFNNKEIPNETCLRFPVYDGNSVAILLFWGIDYSTAIHDHNNYDGRIKVLKGELTEVSYRENSNFIEYDSSKTATEGHIFPEESEGIHSVVNISDDISVSLHIYRTEQLNLEGVRIFDTVHRKVAWLSKDATSCSWDLPANAYTKILKI